MVRSGASPKSEVLIQWQGWPTSWATWEEHTDITRLFPGAPAWGHAGFEDGGSAPAWGHAGFEDGGNVMTCG